MAMPRQITNLPGAPGEISPLVHRQHWATSIKTTATNIPRAESLSVTVRPLKNAKTMKLSINPRLTRSLMAEGHVRNDGGIESY